MALNTLFFDLKINDMTDEQIKAIKSRLEKQLGANLDIGKQIQQSVERTGSTKLKIGADTSAAEAALKRITELLSNPTGSRNEISELNALVKTLKEISSIKDKQSKSDDATNDKQILNANKLNYAYERLFNAERSMSEFAKGSQTSKSFKDAISDIQILLFYLKEARGNAQETEKVLHGIGSASNVNRALRNAEDAVKGMQKERTESEKLQNVIFSLENALKRFQTASRALGNPQGVDAAIQKLREYIELARQASKSPTSTSEFLKSNSLGAGANAKDNVSSQIALARELQRQERAAQATSAAQERLANSQQRAAQATNSHANASVRLGNSLIGLVSITGDLRNQIGMLFSAYTVEHQLKNVVAIGGEFEKQKLAMGSMLGSLEQADDIFNRMKNLALISPFNFKDLSNYSRQLTAFGTPYKDLYNTTNRLADISAGLGGDMSRLVLAFSQVKAAAYLRGPELRQFTEFGVSLPDLLAKKYSEAEHRIVTAGDVIERVSKRMVSFNDVKDVLWKSTDKGGQFYGMQGVLAQSTSGMASNLKDAIDTMYYDIANSNSGMIKGAIKKITEFVSHWRELTSVLAAGTMVYSANRLAMSIHNRWIGLNNSSTVQSIMLQKQEEAAVLKKASTYRTLTSMERERLMMSKQLTLSDLEQLAANKSLSSEQLIQLARTGRITAAQALEVASLYGLNEAQMSYLMGLQKTGVQMTAWQRLMNTNFITRMRIGIQNLVSSIITLPNVLMAAGAALIYFYTSQKQHRDEIEQANEQTVKNAQDGAKNIQDFLNSNPIGDVLKSNNSGEVAKSLEAYKNQLESSPIDMSTVITNIETIPNATDKLKEMRKALEDLKKAHDDISNSTGNMFVVANEATNGFLNDALSTNLKELNNARSELDTQLSKSGGVTDLNKFISESGNVFPEVVKQLKDMGNAAPNKKMEQLFKIISNNGWGDAFKNELDKSNLSGLSDAYNEYLNYADALKTVQNQFVEFNSNIENQLANSGKNIKNLRQEDILSIKEQADEYSKSNNITGEALRMFNMNVENTFIKSDRQLKNESESWKTFTDVLKDELGRKVKDISKASDDQIKDAFNRAMNRCNNFMPWMSGFLGQLQNLVNSNPINILIRIKSMIGKEDAQNGWLYDMINGQLPKSQKNNPNLPKSGSTDINEYHSQLKQNYDSSYENVKLLKAAYKKTKAGTTESIAAYNQLSDAQNELDNIVSNSNAAGFTDIVNQTKNSKSKKQKEGSKTDQFAKDIQARIDQIKKAMDVYKKWKDTGISESESIDKMDASGIFSKGTFKNIVSENGLNDWYKKTLENLSNMVKKAKYTPERKKYTESIAELFGEFDQKATKDKFDEYGKYVDKLISDTKTKWDNYQKLLSAGSNRTDAANFSFGGKSPYGSLSEAMASNFYNELAKNNIRKNIDFGMKEEDVKKLLGDGKIAEEMLKLWKDAKEQIEKDRIDIQINADNAKEQISSIADKIKSSIEKALDHSLGINTSNGKQTKLSEFASVDSETGLLKLNDNAKDVLSPSQIEDAKNMIASENQEITKLSSQLLELMPAWDDIFGKSAYKSISDITRGIKEIDEIISNAKIINDKNGKASYFTSSYTDANGQTQQIKGNIGELDRLKNQKDTLFGDRGKKGIEGAFTNVFDSLGDYFKAKSKAKAAKANGDTEGEEKANNDASDASHKFAASLSDCIGEMQKWNNALSMLGSTVEALGGGTGVSDAAGVAGGMLSGAMSMSSLGPWGMAAGAAMGAITGIAGLHDKKLDRAIEKSKQKVKELDEAYKSIENGLKYALGDASSGMIVNTSEVKKVKEAQNFIASMKNKGKLSIFDLMSLQKSEKILKESAATVKYLDKNDKDNYGNAYNYQRNLYKEQLAELEKQKQAEEDKKKPDQSKINDYNSQIEEMETKITQFSEDLANSLYGIDIKGWASQFGDALFEAWQKGESGAEAFNKTAASILQSLVKSWFKTNVIEVAFKKLQKDLFGENGQGGIFGTNNDLTQEDILKIASDIMSAQGDITSKMKKLDELDAELKKKGIDIKGNSSSSTTNAISGVSEQEANIIAAYMDAIRQDTYNMRMNLLKIVENGVKIESSPMMQAQLLQLQQIQSNTYRNMELVGDIKSMFNDVILGNKKIYVN